MLETILLLSVICTLAIISPGPDFFLILKNASLYSKTSALTTVAGITLGIMVHISYCILGIGWIISRSVLFYNLLKYVGAAYLIFIGFQSVCSKSGRTKFEAQKSRLKETPTKAFYEGFFCNLLNPKVTLMMLSVFTQVIEPDTSLIEQLVYSSVFVIITIVYWSTLVLIIQQKIVQQWLAKTQRTVDRIFGTILITLGIKVAFSK